MSYNESPQSATSASPILFLAVLAGIMGSLLLVLVLLTRMTRENVVEIAVENERSAVEVKLQDQTTQKKQRYDKLQDYVAELDSVRAEASRNLHQNELKLSRIEDETRKLNQKLEELKRVAAELNKAGESHFDDREKVRSEAIRLQNLVKKTRSEIAQLRSERPDVEKSYAIVPPKNQNGIARPAIYIECRSEEVILQPEGIRLTMDDFTTPVGPSNPLAVALRAAREYVIRQNPAVAADASLAPYPLVLIRPDGEQTFDMVCAAIQSWETDYGYEPIGADWKLDFPPVNPQLAAIQQQVVDQARARQQVLIGGTPRIYSPPETLNNNRWPVPPAYPSTGIPQAGLAQNAANERRVALGPGFSPVLERSEGPIFFGADRDQAINHELAPLADSRIARRIEDGADDSQSEEPGGEFKPIGRVRPLAKVNGSAVRRAIDKLTQPFGIQSAESEEQESQDGREADLLDEPQEFSDDDDGSASASRMSTQPPPSPDLHADAMRRGDGQVSLGNLSRKGSRDAIPIRRNIHVVVTDEYLSILADEDGNGSEAPVDQKLRFDEPSHRMNAKFVSALSGHMKDWGSAGHGMYWRPILMLDALPGGEDHAEQLAAAIRGSGMETRFINTSMAQRENEPTATESR